MDLPLLLAEKLSPHLKSSDFVIRTTNTCLEDLSQYFSDNVLVGDWLIIQAQNPKDSSAPVTQDLARVIRRNNLQVSRGLSGRLRLRRGQPFTFSPIHHFRQDSKAEDRSWCPFIARLRFYRSVLVATIPRRIYDFLNLEVGSLIQFEVDRFQFQTEIGRKYTVSILKSHLRWLFSQKKTWEQAIIRKLQQLKSANQQPTGQPCHLLREAISGGQGKKSFVFPLTADHLQSLRESFRDVFRGDLLHGKLENPRTLKQVNFILPIRAAMRINFSRFLTNACDFKAGDPAILKIQKVIPQGQVGIFSTNLPFDVNFCCYTYESRLVLPEHIVALYGLKLHDLVRLHLGGRRFILKLCYKRKLIIAGKNPLGLQPGEQRLETITIAKVGKVGKQRRLRRLGKKHEALKLLFQKLIKEDFVPEIASVDEVEPFYSNGSATGARPDFRVVLKDQTLAHVELKAFNTLAHIDLKHEEQFQKYAELGLPLILVTTTRSSYVHQELLSYFSHVFALEQLEDMVRQSGSRDFREQLASIVKRIQ
jgi:hypothetical protein